MRLVTFLADGVARAGALRGDEVVDLNRADPALPTTVLALIEGGDAALDRARRAVQSAPAAAVRPLAAVRLLAPIPRPPKMMFTGLNYKDHVAEATSKGLAAPDKPPVFVKVSSAVIGPGEAIIHPPTTQQLDYEGELGVVIGKRATRVPPEQVLGHIAGYTIINDVSARDIQFSKTGAMGLGKNFDTASPMGPYVALVDELSDASDLQLRTYVNGELRQNARTSWMIFDIPTIISFITQQLTLEPGDVVATGTPAGVGFARTPAVWLQAGDVIRIEIEGLGALENPVVGP